jgi:hypothetical protein
MCAKKMAMLSPGEIALIKAEINRLEEARQECRDNGIQKVIDAWIEELKKKLLV